MTDPTVVRSLGTDGVATVRLNRPDAMNALDTATKVALLDTLRAVAADPAVRCVVLTGTGRAFCVGQDLKEHITLLEGGANLADTVTEHYNPTAVLLATMPKPVVAAVNGVAAGAGASLAFGTDIRVMADTAGINLAFTAIGLSADTGATWWLPRLVGAARAKELLLMPRTIPAAECLDLGLVSAVVPAAELDDAVAELAGRLAAGPTLAYAAIRDAVAFSVSHDLVESLDHEAAHMARTGMSADHAAAVRAFIEKRPAVFEGR